uniref:Uncharacterized protein n=1 Tax=Molossus molossus TaxID=27622 RepID=A0A7J8I8Q6_MOLMO|nr:hypothetical protein HJG59_010510 [Molossus molossus]
MQADGPSLLSSLLPWPRVLTCPAVETELGEQEVGGISSLGAGYTAGSGMRLGHSPSSWGADRPERPAGLPWSPRVCSQPLYYPQAHRPLPPRPSIPSAAPQNSFLPVLLPPEFCPLPTRHHTAPGSSPVGTELCSSPAFQAGRAGAGSAELVGGLPGTGFCSPSSASHTKDPGLFPKICFMNETLKSRG